MRHEASCKWSEQKIFWSHPLDWFKMHFRVFHAVKEALGKLPLLLLPWRFYHFSQICSEIQVQFSLSNLECIFAILSRLMQEILCSFALTWLCCLLLSFQNWFNLLKPFKNGSVSKFIFWIILHRQFKIRQQPTILQPAQHSAEPDWKVCI